MPDAKTLKRVAKDRSEGKSTGSQAGEFVRQEMNHIRQGKHGARSPEQAIAIGLSEARRAGVKVAPGKNAPTRVKKRTRQDRAAAARGRRPSVKRSRVTKKTLEREPREAASHKALSRHAKRVAPRAKKTRRAHA